MKSIVIASIISEYHRYKTLADKAISQINDHELRSAIGVDTNSIAVIVKHLSGNLISRFTNFLTEDGEKPWRDRDGEFTETMIERTQLLQHWEEAWHILFAVLNDLNEMDVNKIVRIRDQEMTVSAALHRSLAHTAYHVGQIVLLARCFAGPNWQNLSIPRGQS